MKISFYHKCIRHLIPDPSPPRRREGLKFFYLKNYNKMQAFYISNVIRKAGVLFKIHTSEDMVYSSSSHPSASSEFRSEINLEGFDRVIPAALSYKFIG